MERQNAFAFVQNSFLLYSCSEYRNICLHVFCQLFWPFVRIRSVVAALVVFELQNGKINANENTHFVSFAMMTEGTLWLKRRQIATLWRSPELRNDNFGAVTAIATSTTQRMDRFRLERLQLHVILNRCLCSLSSSSASSFFGDFFWGSRRRTNCVCIILCWHRCYALLFIIMYFTK